MLERVQLDSIEAEDIFYQPGIDANVYGSTGLLVQLEKAV